MPPKRAAVGFAVFGFADLVAALSIGFPTAIALHVVSLPTSARATAADRRPGTVPGSQPGDSVTPTGDDRQPGLRGASVDSEQGLSDNGAGG